MGSYCETYLDEIFVWTSKSYVDEIMLSLFCEDDRRIRVLTDKGQKSNSYEYACKAGHMADRLDAMGFTITRAIKDYERLRKDEIEMIESWDYDFSDTAVNFLRTWDFKTWSQHLKALVKKGAQQWSVEEFEDNPDITRIYEERDLTFGGYFSDARYYIRALLTIFPRRDELVLNYTDLVDGGYYSEDEELCDDARLDWSETHPIFGPIVLLTEGRADTRVLKNGMSKLHPHMSSLYSFLDFEGYRVEGGASILMKTVNAFAAARINTRMIAIFDNDPAGIHAHQQLLKKSLPANIKVMILPNIPIAQSYPTRGPQGSIKMDVNGMAGSIEMYLGKEALSDEQGVLRPVVWGGFHDKQNTYHGVIDNKAAVHNAFLKKISKAKCAKEAQEKFPELNKILQQVFSVFSQPV